MGFVQDITNYIIQLFNVKDFITKNFDFNDDELRTYIFKNFIFSISIFVASIIIFYASTDSNSLTNRTFTYAFLIGLPLILGIIYSANIADLSDESYVQKFFIGAFLLFILTIIIYFLSISSSSVFTTINNVIVLIIICIIIIGLALFYNIFSNSLKNQRGVSGIIINLIFYIPCLLNDFLLYIKSQVGITPSTVLILFVLEILFILLYLYIPKLFSFIEKKNSIVLLEEPVYLNKPITISNSDTFKLIDGVKMDKEIINNDQSISPVYRNSNYAFSFWVFINPEYNINDNIYKNIFNYANGKPCVKFYNNKFFINVTNNGDNITQKKEDYKITSPIQKWNNFTFNYLDNSVDLFVNGILEISFSFNKNNVPLDGTSTDIVTVGEQNGLSGSICNVKYYKTSLSSSQIVNNYYLLSTLNPPILHS